MAEPGPQEGLRVLCDSVHYDPVAREKFISGVADLIGKGEVLGSPDSGIKSSPTDDEAILEAREVARSRRYGEVLHASVTADLDVTD